MDSRFSSVNNLRCMIFSLLAERISFQLIYHKHICNRACHACTIFYFQVSLSIIFVASSSVRNLSTKCTAESVVSDSGADSSSASGFLVT